MKRKTMVPVAIVLLVLLDQLVKWYVVKNIPLGVVKSFIPHVVSLTYLQNTGAAFSLLENQQDVYKRQQLAKSVDAFPKGVASTQLITHSTLEGPVEKLLGWTIGNATTGDIKAILGVVAVSYTHLCRSD